MRRHRGYALWGFSCLAISVAGFWSSFFAPLIVGDYTNFVPNMPLHTASSGLWVILITVQPALVVSGRINIHRILGVFGAWVAAALIVTGILVQIDTMARYAAMGNVGDAVYTPFFRLVTLLIFAVCVIAALIWRNRSDWHKRLMLLGTFALLEAPISRFLVNVIGVAPDKGGLMAAIAHTLMMVLFLAWDRRRLGRFHPVTLWGTIIITLIVFGTAPIAFSDWWGGVAARLAGV